MKPAAILVLIATALALPIPKPDADAEAQGGWWHQDDGPLPLWKKVAAAEPEPEK